MFDERERRVFKYHNGVAEVWGDPLVLERRLRAYMGGNGKQLISDMNSVLDTEGKVVADADFSKADAASEVFVEAVAKAFEIPKLFDTKTGEGYTEKNLRDLWDKFQQWVEDKKKEQSSGPGMPPHTPPFPLPRQPGR